MSELSSKIQKILPSAFRNNKFQEVYNNFVSYSVRLCNCKTWYLGLD